MTRKSTIRKRTQRFADESLASARQSARAGRKAAKAGGKAAKSGWTDITDVFGGVAGRTQTLAGETRSRLMDIQGEGVRRGKAAKDALAGRRPKKRRGWLAGTAALGVGVGAAATVLARKVNAARERMQAEQAATAVAEDLRKAESVRSSKTELDELGLGNRTNGVSAPTVPAPKATTTSSAASTSATKPTTVTKPPAATTLPTAPDTRKPTS